ncbi:homoserine dehydrogenase [Streptomyces sp. ALI-76-A]|uniref:homoserine dehydrogenase n=1 Tax=Streptomyces sp. ALI-76-A TaxID=3025736 RepID=UPI00256F3788|nr:homoserine dehydrogenase [Streptomyces sp. ALI-76-A]MDL5205966.1 homoserine dehydrogenase [Streptomyces sp. ALI-76-A]
MRTLKVALLGCGTVGGEVARHLTGHAAELAGRIGAPVELAGIAVRRTGLARPGVPDRLVTTDADALVRRGDIDVVIEVIGGTDPARGLITAAFAHGASVVSANKALIAAEGAELHAAAAARGVDLYYEAAVAGAVPLLRPLRESLAGDRVNRVMGILNGTTNFILDKMHSAGWDYPRALKEATALGYAEADPTADVEGYDAAAKAAILAGFAFGARVPVDAVHREGITAITAADIDDAKAAGCVMKLVAVCERGADGLSVNARVHPAMIRSDHPLASVRGAYNAVMVEADAAGELTFHGPGAGGAPTASAVLGDLVTVCRNKLAGVTGPGDAARDRPAVRPMAEVVSRYHLSLDLGPDLDTNGQADVLAETATVLSRYGVSVASLSQQRRDGRFSLALSTHPATHATLSAAVCALRDMAPVQRVTSVIRLG